MSDYSNGQILIASCFAFSDPKCVHFFNNFGEALAERKVQLVVLGTKDAPEIEFPQLQIPYSVIGFDKLVNIPHLTPIHAVPLIANSERAWTGSTASADTWARATAKCEWFYQVVAEELAPCGALLWNTSHPNSRIARNVLQINDIPAWGVERGQLAGTYQIQSGEVNAWDDSLAVFSAFAGLPTDMDGLSNDVFEAARAFSKETSIDRHVVTATGSKSYSSGNGPTLLILTSALGSSIEPANLRTNNLSQPFWSGLQSIIDALDSVIPADVTILFRDHPINRSVIGAPLRLPARFIPVPDIPSGDLIDHADRVACIGTTTLQYEALLRDKPLLLLGRSIVSRAGAAYSPASTEALKSTVSAWIGDNNGELHRRNARALIGYLCERTLIREGDHVSHVRHSIMDLADFIAAQAVTGTAPVSDRIEKFTKRFLDGCTTGDY